MSFEILVVIVTIAAVASMGYGLYRELKGTRKSEDEPKSHLPEKAQRSDIFVIVEEKDVDINRIKQVYAEYFQSGDWRKALKDLGHVLPQVVEQQALVSPRSAPEITNDYFKLVLEPLLYDFKDVSEARKDQSQKSFKQGWIAAYPSVDLVRNADGGMFDTLLENLNKGVLYIFFQQDEFYFLELKKMLAEDPRLVNSEILNTESRDCCLWCVTPFISPLEIGMYNPGTEKMEGYINVGNPIELTKVGNLWLTTSRVILKPVLNKQQLWITYDKFFKPAYLKYFEGKPNAPVGAKV